MASHAFPATSGSSGGDAATQTYVLTSLQLLDSFKRYLHQSGLRSSIDNIKSLGWATKRYPDLVQKLDEGKCVKYGVRCGRSAHR